MIINKNKKYTMNKVKIEPADDYNDSDLNSVVIINEAYEEDGDISIKVEIKQEPELIIESELPWISANLKHDSDDEDMLSAIKPVLTEYQEFLIEYIAATEGQAQIEYEKYLTECIKVNEERSNNVYISHTEHNGSDEDSENGNVDMDSNSCMELTQNLDTDQENEIPEDMESDNGSTKIFCQRTFLKWLSSNYIHYACPICDEKCKTYNILATHVNQQHKDYIDDTKCSNYYFDKTAKAICKQCNKYLNRDYSLVLHSLRHTQQDTLKLRICSRCQFKAVEIKCIQNHIMKQHPDIKELFKSLNIESAEEEKYICPLCPTIFNNPNHIRFHFIDKHPNEYGEIYSYSCHLCPKTNNDIFDNMDKFYKHLLEKHNLKNWNLMNFKIFTKTKAEQHFYYCAKCFKIFFEMDLIKFLLHYLEHDNYYRFCTACHKKLSIKNHNFYHMCDGQLKKFRNRAVENRKNETNALSRLQQFEEYIKHVCSFCNQEFETLQHWQLHLSKTHQLDTLKGLEMQNIPKDSTKLQCNICNTFVINSSVQLLNHRFQHLPYKTYKCRYCSLKFNSYKNAFDHVLKKCQGQEKPNEIKTIQESHEMVCPLCQSPKFTNKKKILQHYIEKHNNFLDYYTKQLDTTLVCNVCHLQVTNDVNLCRIHILSHFDQKPHKCLKCSQSFYCRNACLIHVNYHFAKPVTQQQKPKNNLLQHSNDEKLKNAKNKNASILLERSKTLTEFIDYINFACRECNLCLETQEVWLNHVNEEHNFLQDHNVSVKDPLNGSFKCIHCQEKLPSSIVKRQRHKFTHMPYKSYICNLCNHRTTTLYVLYAHLRRAHFAKGSYVCAICPESLTTSHERTEHLKNMHPRSEWPDNLCIVCYKTFALGSMADHMLTHDRNHTNLGKTNKNSADQYKNYISSTPDINPNKTNSIKGGGKQKRKSNLKSVNTKKKSKSETNKKNLE